MDLLKLAFITLLALVSLDYSEGVSDIIFTVDASLEDSERVLMQLVQGKSIRQNMRTEFGLARRRNMMQLSENVERF